MAIQGYLIGALKTALQKAVQKYATKEGVKLVSKETLKNIGKLTDAQAILLNRAKNYGNKELYSFLENSLKIPEKDIKGILKIYNQTQNAKELAKGEKFKELLRTKLRKELKTNADTKIKDLKRKIKEENAISRANNQNGDFNTKEYYNAMVKGLLNDIEKNVIEKTQGYTKNKTRFKLKVNFKKYYQNGKDYDKTHVEGLETILNNINNDIALYDTGSGDDLILLDIGNSEYVPYSKNLLLAYVNEIKQDIITILGG